MLWSPNAAPAAVLSHGASSMKSVELFIERLLMASRWVLVVFYLGLAAALVVYAVSFIAKFAKVAGAVFVLNEADMILAMLGLIDAALVASLIVMVMLAGYENFVSRIDQAAANAEIGWLGKLDAGSLKIKVASSIVAISSIHLLQVFLNLQSYSTSQLLWATVIHLTFVFSALILAILDRIVSYGKDKGAVEKTGA
jgi:uncharacterized protein (TIGR00645 family)